MYERDSANRSLRHDFFSRGGFALQSCIPFVRGGLKLRVNFAELPENPSRQIQGVFSTQRDRLPMPWLREVRQAIHSARRLLPAIRAAPAAFSLPLSLALKLSRYSTRPTGSRRTR